MVGDIDGEAVGEIDEDEIDEVDTEVETVDLDVAMLIQDIGTTSFGFTSLISRLAGTLPRLVETEVEISEARSCSFPFLFFSD